MLNSVLIIKHIILTLAVLVSVAFITLLEHKILAYTQKRKGPNKVGYKGLLQPFSDAIKLFIKEPIYPAKSNLYIFILSPLLMFSIMLIMWFCYPSSFSMSEIYLSIILFLSCLSISVYSSLMAGWASNSKYALLGSLRALAQTISYEVSLALILLSFIVITSSYSMETFSKTPSQWFMFMSIPLSLIWLITCLAETSRTPFDFSEGESELVSGFNTEYSSGTFALFIMAEYGNVMFMSFLFALMFMGGSESPLFSIKLTTIAFTFIWVRGTLPRMRYDKLMYLAWKVFLPVSLNYLLFFTSMKTIFITYW
uniref:NADH-ubiquinone oxidoreductase chain 1 n=1 Tax=Eophreatoicus karrkkanj TaxID=496899 RepID=D3U709_9CRUS|nr:NADH dehydrogenase subunit 1 [Eophreatoicus sp. 14 FK-2009]ACN72767.1 NADH dehydrogenase subunit 1 [Eophreatoicus karrkkanj]